MAGLQRSAVSFRRQGSSGTVWGDRFLSGELNQHHNEEIQQHHHGVLSSVYDKEQGVVFAGDDNIKDAIKPTRKVGSAARMERSQSNGGGRGRAREASPAVEPPSPRLSFCGCFGAKTGALKNPKKNTGELR